MRNASTYSGMKTASTAFRFSWPHQINEFRDYRTPANDGHSDAVARRNACRDKRLLEEAYELLAGHTELETHGVLLHAFHGTLVIEGEVGSNEMKTRIDALLKNSLDVRKVVNSLDVRPTTPIACRTYVQELRRASLAA